jgi:hypothetical protein
LKRCIAAFMAVFFMLMALVPTAIALPSAFETNQYYRDMVLRNRTDRLPAVRTVMVLNNDLVSILKDVEHIPYKSENLRFVALAKSTVEDTQIQSSAELTALLSQLLSMEVRTIPIYQITSLSLGAEVYDLAGILP